MIKELILNNAHNNYSIDKYYFQKDININKDIKNQLILMR